MRLASLEDHQSLKEMSMSFIETTSYDFDEETIDNLLKVFLTSSNNEKIILFEEGKGFLAGMAVPFIFSKGYVATEIAWWVSPEERKNGVGDALLNAFEFWANKIGCSSVVMVALDDYLGEFYKKKGYELLERAYIKRI